MSKNYLYIPILLFLFACKKESSFNTGTEDPSRIHDQFGRQVILHGLNTSSSAKYANDRQPWILESDVQREADSFGFNAVRYLIFWDAIEPQQGVFDDAYLDKVEQRVNWYAAHGMHVILDMHQDLYSIRFGGDGAPDWAIRANGHPVNSNNPYGNQWFLKSLDPAVISCFVNFWEYSQYKELQDHYLLTWKKVAERFKDHPYVIGYDLMNEPYAGDLIKNLNGNFELTQLTDFYNRLIPAIRSVDMNKYIFFEPTSLGVNNGVASALQKLDDPRSPARMCYAPHCYPLFIEAMPGPYDATAMEHMRSWKMQRSREIKKYNCPILIGEFGLSPDLPGFEAFLNEVFAYTDSVQGGWTYWSNDYGSWSPLNADRSERPGLQYMIRTYPKAVAGRISHFRFDPSTKNFTLTYTANSSITHPTEVFIPARHYPAGWNVSVSGSTGIVQEYDAGKQTLLLSGAKNGSEVTVQIKPK